MHFLSRSGLLLCVAMLLGCYPKGDPDKPVPTTLLPAAGPAERLVVVLPGRGDDLDKLSASGVAGVIQAQWPDADVELTGLTLGYYMRGNAEQRLHDDVVAPARRRGYREVWMVGVSMGGMGTLMYDRAYPREIDGMVLLAPYLGDKPLLEEIAAAGGPANWNPGPVPATVNRENFQRELWRHLQSWSRDPELATNVWLGYGDRDRLGDGFALLRPILREDQVSRYDGGHTWSVWTKAAGDIFSRAGEKTVAKAARSDQVAP